MNDGIDDLQRSKTIELDYLKGELAVLQEVVSSIAIIL